MRPEDLFGERSPALDACRRMRPLGRSATAVCIPLQAAELLPHMCGMVEVAALLQDVFSKPTLAKRRFARMVGRLSGLHFALVGRPGTGRRTAVRSACATCGIDMLTIAPEQYVYQDLGVAMNYCLAFKPCVLYFDGFDALLKNRDFCNEFGFQILGQEPVADTWDGMYLAFGIENPALLAAQPLLRLCKNRYATVRDLDAEDAARLLFRVFLPEGGAKVNADDLTDKQWDDLETAVKRCTPRDLKDFASVVQWSALSRISVRSHAEDSGIPVMASDKSVSLPGPSTAAAAAAVDAAPGPIVVDWAQDVEANYVVIPPDRSPTGVLAYAVPRYREGCWSFQQSPDG